MRTTTSLAKLSHREPVPRGILPKLRHLTKNIPNPGILLPVCILCGVALVPIHRFAMESEYFRVKTWNIVGLERLTEEEVRWLVGDKEGKYYNIIAFPIDEAEDLLETHPAVRRAEVEKVYPNQLNIVLFERSPEFIVVTASDSFLVDLDGVVFAHAQGKDLLQSDLPFFTVSREAPLQLGDQLDREFVDQALVYYETLKKSGRSVVLDVAEYHYDPGAGLTLILRNGTRLICGSKPPQVTLPRYEALLRTLDPDASLRYADLRIGSHVPYKFSS